MFVNLELLIPLNYFICFHLTYCLTPRELLCHFKNFCIKLFNFLISFLQLRILFFYFLEQLLGTFLIAIDIEVFSLNMSTLRFSAHDINVISLQLDVHHARLHLDQ